MTSPEATPLSRDELVTMVTKAHQDAAYGDATATGRSLAAQSKLPKLIAENLGAGFGQWDFFPEPADIVDFALAYVAPQTEDDVWALARKWAEDDAAGKHTILALVGREIMTHELRRIDVPKLKELFDERRSTRANALRAALGLAVPSPSAEPAAKKTSKRKAAGSAGAPSPASGPPAAPRPPLERLAEGGFRMPKPAFVKPAPKAAAPPPKRYQHPKFGEGFLEAQQGTGPEAKLTIKFSVGSKTLQAKYVTEVAEDAPPT